MLSKNGKSPTSTGARPPSLTRSGVRRAPVELGHGSNAGFFSEMCVFYRFWTTFRDYQSSFPEFISVLQCVPAAKDHLKRKRNAKHHMTRMKKP